VFDVLFQVPVVAGNDGSACAYMTFSIIPEPVVVPSTNIDIFGSLHNIL
jgi:hypothetical protein